MKNYMCIAKFSNSVTKFTAANNQNAVDLMYSTIGEGWRNLYDLYQVVEVVS